MNLPPSAAPALEQCGREPIHIPGAIQPHGVLFVVEAATFVCLQVSANLAQVTGRAPSEVLGLPATDFLQARGESLEAIFHLEDPATEAPLPVQFGESVYDGIIHRQGDRLIIELEPFSEAAPLRYHRKLQGMFKELRATADPAALYDLCARFIADLTGYERVMVYKFDDDWHGTVVGEHLLAEVDSYRGHHFPASDIPEQARTLYRTNWLRIIPDVNYTPAPLEPLLDPRTGRPIDLSKAALRSVSPIHLQYMRNMDVGASMSISLLLGGRLWGLIACHHRKARPLRYATRAACEIFGQVASLEIEAKEESRRLAEHVRATAIQTQFFDFIAQEPNVVEALVKYTPNLLEFMAAGGAAIYVNGELTQLGATPGRAEVGRLIEWLKERAPNPIFATDSLSKHFPEAEVYKTVASGLLAVRLSRVEHHYVLWFRPEVVTTVTWAGDPEKPVETGQVMNPRKSFAAWKQIVTGRSLPWTETEEHGARELRNALNALVLRRTERLLQLNAELERKNTDLNSFAYIASHDLKEPLRGIANYGAFLEEDYGATLDPEALQKLQTMRALAGRSEQLLDALNHFSRIGRIEVTRQKTNLNDLVDHVLQGLETFLSERKVEIRRPEPLPTIECDAVLVREVFANLITNAARYNDSAERWVEVGCKTGTEVGREMVFYVRDNGIGIREKHFQAVFHIFRRLHAQDHFGGGTGAGLAIVKSIVERHGGSIWIESTIGQGTTFLFTLG